MYQVKTHYAKYLMSKLFSMFGITLLYMYIDKIIRNDFTISIHIRNRPEEQSRHHKCWNRATDHEIRRNSKLGEIPFSLLEIDLEFNIFIKFLQYNYFRMCEITTYRTPVVLLFFVECSILVSSTNKLNVILLFFFFFFFKE